MGVDTSKRHRESAPEAHLPPIESDILVNDDISYPEGGSEAWMVVIGAWCAMIPPMGLINTLAVLQAWVSENELPNITESKTGWIFSCYAFFITACGAQVGPIFDAHDIKVLMIPGSIGIVASMIFLSLSKEFYQFLLSFGVLGGISASLLFNPSLSAIGHWFCKRRAFATGLACTAGGLGGVAFSLIILYLAPRIGFPWAIRVIAFISTGLLIIANIFLQKRIPENKNARVSINFGLLRNIKFAVTVLAIFFVEFAVFIPYSYISSYALYHGFSSRQAYLLNVLLNAGAIPGRILPGYIADRFGAFNTMCVTTLTCAAFILGLWLIADGGQAKTMSFSVLFGFWSGAAISLSPVCVSRVCKIEDYGKSNGMAYFIASFGALIGIPIAGSLLDTTSDPYQSLIIFAGGFYVAAFVVFCVARGIAGGWKLGPF
ncbi:major facilitator superfamily domain-containing protein [Ilyonectria destructans]|nr:major facilitator superfamily domain-containing protein [Ilyonectria destructans]